MCKFCKKVPPSFDTSYGSDPIATDYHPTVKPADSKNILALRVTAAELAKILMTAKTDPVAIDMWDEGAALEFEGKYYTFGVSPQAMEDMRDFVQYISTPERATAEDMTDADVLPQTDQQPTELEADIHESATVENTNKLIEDLEQQLDDSKADNIHMQNLVQQMDIRHNNAARVLITQRDDARRKALVFGNVIKVAGDALREQADEIARLNAQGEDLASYSRGIFNQLMRTKRSHIALYDQTVTLNKRNEFLQATVDYLKRPFYQRWAIALRGMMGN